MRDHAQELTSLRRRHENGTLLGRRTMAGRLAILPRPRGGDWLEDEVRGRRAAGVDVIVSLLTSDEVTNLDLAQERCLCQAHGRFLAVPDH
jgi:hypothetical protein